MRSRLNDVLAERGRTHGDWSDNARLAQQMKELFRQEKGWLKLSACQREALDMIAGKISRVLSGDCDHVDHWRDVAGYAQLVVRELDADGDGK
jgi:hypothetical protein